MKQMLKTILPYNAWKIHEGIFKFESIKALRLSTVQDLKKSKTYKKSTGRVAIFESSKYDDIEYEVARPIGSIFRIINRDIRSKFPSVRRSEEEGG